MREKNKLIRVYSGTEVLVNMLKGRLEYIGISSFTKNDSITAYLESNPPPVIDLYIKEGDLKKAKSLINEFNRKSMN